MKKVLIILMALVFGAAGLAAQEKPAGEKKAKKQAQAAAKQDRVSGVILRQNKEASTLTIRRDSIERTVVYDSSTKWTKDQKPAESSEFKDGSRVICVGKFDEKARLIATRCELRPPR